MQQEWESNLNLLNLEFLPLQSTSRMLLSPSSCISGMVMKTPQAIPPGKEFGCSSWRLNLAGQWNAHLVLRKSCTKFPARWCHRCWANDPKRDWQREELSVLTANAINTSQKSLRVHVPDSSQPWRWGRPPEEEEDHLFSFHQHYTSSWHT